MLFFSLPPWHFSCSSSCFFFRSLRDTFRALVRAFFPLPPWHFSCSSSCFFFAPSVLLFVLCFVLVVTAIRIQPMSSCFLRLCFFFNHFLFLFLCSNLFPFYLASFFLESKPKAFQRILFSQAKKHEWSGYTIVWFVWGYTIVSSCFLRLCFFQPFPFPFPLLKYFSFIFSIVSFI